jgi:hypothetical protein
MMTRTCACGCGGHPLPKRKYVKGHRPLQTTRDGYRRVWVTKHHPLANADGNCMEHRLVLFNAGVTIPAGYQVHHRNGDKLDNRLENLEVIKATDHGSLHSPNTGKTHCKHGHPFDEENTWVSARGWRYCRTCNRLRARRRMRFPEGVA